MGVSFLDHPAERNGVINVTHSLGSGRGAQDIKRVRNAIIDPHGSLKVPQVDGLEDYLSTLDFATLQRLLAVEADLGIPALRAALVARLPDTLAIDFEGNRGLVDPNRRLEFALQPVVNGAAPSVKQGLLGWHAEGLNAVDQILGQMGPDVRVSLLHSSEVFEYPTLTDADLRDAASFKAYLDRVCAIREKEYNRCIMTGDKDGSTRADAVFNGLLMRRLAALGIPYAVDNPWVTKLGRHKTSDYMSARPDRVNAMDWLKPDLATGAVGDGTFALDTSEPDPEKVDNIAGIIADTLKEAAGEL